MSPPPTTAEARARLRSALSYRRGSGHVVAAVLLGLLGFALAIQLSDATDVLSRASRADLVQILGGLDTRTEQLEAELARLEQARSELLAGAGDSEAALAEAQARLDTFGILAGSTAAEGPGVTVRIADPTGAVRAITMIGTVQELRDAGAEAIQIKGGPDRVVRVVASTPFADLPSAGVSVGDVALTPPYLVEAIGDPDTLQTALGIPGGAVAAITSAGGSVDVRQSERLLVDALHEVTEPTYARPAPPADGD